jgi:hypothetical protein
MEEFAGGWPFVICTISINYEVKSRITQFWLAPSSPILVSLPKQLVLPPSSHFSSAMEAGCLLINLLWVG